MRFLASYSYFGQFFFSDCITIEAENDNALSLDEEEKEDPYAGDDNLNDPDFLPNSDLDNESDQEKEFVIPKKKIKVLKKASENNINETLRYGVPCRRSRKIRAERKEKRNLGKAYVTENGKIISEKKCSEELPQCRMKCKNKFNYAIRKELFDSFWAMSSRDRRADYLSGLVTSQSKATQRLRHEGQSIRNRTLTNVYHLKISGQLQVICKNCFQKTFDVTDGFIKYMLTSRTINTAGIAQTDQRGAHPPSSKTSEERRSEVFAHINSFPRYKSHYSRRHTDKEYLAANLNIRLMYSLYKESHSDPVSYAIYRQLFNEMNLSFKMPHNDTCNTCDTFSLQFKLASREEQEAIQTEWDQHKDMADKHFRAKSSDKEHAKIDKSTKMISFDLQQVLATPHIQTNVIFYKRQLSVYNLTIYDGADGIAHNFLWDETKAGRGANQIGSCVFKYFTELPAEVSQVIMYSDTCTGQNRNSHIAAMCFSALQKNPHLKSIDHKFMVSGHSHMECDTAHAMIEKKKKRTDMRIHHPWDWAQLIRTVGKKDKFLVTEMQQEHFFDFKSFYTQKLQIKNKNEENEKFVWHDVQWMRFTSDQIGIIQYKTSVDALEPFKKISFLRRRQGNPVLDAPRQYSKLIPISEEKKKDLLSILHLIDPVFHHYYKNLPVLSSSCGNEQNSSSEDEH